MKIGFLIYSIGGGGAERVLCSLANSFASNGHETSVITYVRTDSEYSLANQIKRYVLLDNPRDGYGLIGTIRRIYKLFKVCRKEQYDFVIPFMGSAITESIFVSLFCKSKIVFSIRSNPRVTHPSGLSTSILRFWMRHAAGAVFQTKDALSWAPKKVQRRAKVIFNPIKEDFFKVSWKGLQTKNLVTIGRLVGEKGHDMLIRAMKIVCQQLPDVILHIYGDGPQEDKDRQLIQTLGITRNVVMMGRTKDAPSILVNHRLFVLSSNTEGMPNALMEAMAVGMPVISTDCPCGGPKELLGTSLSDCLVPIGDCDKMAKSILSIINDESQLIKTSKIVHSIAAKYTQNNIYHEWVEYLNSLIGYNQK